MTSFQLIIGIYIILLKVLRGVDPRRNMISSRGLPRRNRFLRGVDPRRNMVSSRYIVSSRGRPAKKYVFFAGRPPEEIEIP